MAEDTTVVDLGQMDAFAEESSEFAKQWEELYSYFDNLYEARLEFHDIFEEINRIIQEDATKEGSQVFSRFIHKLEHTADSLDTNRKQKRIARKALDELHKKFDGAKSDFFKKIKDILDQETTMYLTYVAEHHRKSLSGAVAIQIPSSGTKTASSVETKETSCTETKGTLSAKIKKMSLTVKKKPTWLVTKKTPSTGIKKASSTLTKETPSTDTKKASSTLTKKTPSTRTKETPLTVTTKTKSTKSKETSSVLTRKITSTFPIQTLSAESKEALSTATNGKISTETIGPNLTAHTESELRKQPHKVRPGVCVILDADNKADDVRELKELFADIGYETQEIPYEGTDPVPSINGALEASVGPHDGSAIVIVIDKTYHRFERSENKYVAKYEEVFKDVKHLDGKPKILITHCLYGPNVSLAQPPADSLHVCSQIIATPKVTFKYPGSFNAVIGDDEERKIRITEDLCTALSEISEVGTERIKNLKLDPDEMCVSFELKPASLGDKCAEEALYYIQTAIETNTFRYTIGGHRALSDSFKVHNTHEASLFVRSLDYILRQCHQGCDINELLTKVLRDVEIPQHIRKRDMRKAGNTVPYHRVVFKTSLKSPFRFKVESHKDLTRSRDLPLHKDSMSSTCGHFSLIQGQFKGLERLAIQDLKTVFSFDIELKEPTISKHHYRMDRKTRGLCIIVNMSNDRSGSVVDEAKMTQLFEELYFEVRSINNRTHKEIEEEIRAMTTMISDLHQSLVLFIMGHGTTEDKVHFFADVTYTKKSSTYVLDAFKNQAHLNGKPKLFIIQTCFGVETMKGHVGETTGKDTVGPGTTMKPMLLNEHFAVHKDSDTLQLNATLEEYMSFRMPLDGSYLIQAVDQVLREYSAEKDVTQLMTLVKNKVLRLGLDRKALQQAKVEDIQNLHLNLNPGYSACVSPTLPDIMKHNELSRDGSVVWQESCYSYVIAEYCGNIMKLFNTVTGETRVFDPINPRNVSGILCGMSIEDSFNTTSSEHVIVVRNKHISRRCLHIKLEDKTWKILSALPIDDPLILCPINYDGIAILARTQATNHDSIHVYSCSDIRRGASKANPRHKITVKSAEHATLELGPLDKMCYSNTKFYIYGYNSSKVYQINSSGNIAHVYGQLASRPGTKKPRYTYKPRGLFAQYIYNAHRDDMYERIIVSCFDGIHLARIRENKPFDAEWSIDVLDLNMYGTNALVPALQTTPVGNNTPYNTHQFDSQLVQTVWCTLDPDVVAVGSAESAHITLVGSDGESLGTQFINRNARIMSGINVFKNTHLVVLRDEEKSYLHCLEISSGKYINNNDNNINKPETIEAMSLFIVDNKHYGMLSKKTQRKHESAIIEIFTRETYIQQTKVRLDFIAPGVNDRACLDKNGLYIVTNYDMNRIYTFDIDGTKLDEIDTPSLGPYSVMVDVLNELLVLCKDGLYKSTKNSHTEAGSAMNHWCKLINTPLWDVCCSETHLYTIYKQSLNVYKTDNLIYDSTESVVSKAVPENKNLPLLKFAEPGAILKDDQVQKYKRTYKSKIEKTDEKWRSQEKPLYQSHIKTFAPLTFICIFCEKKDDEIIYCADCGPSAYMCGDCSDHIHQFAVLHIPLIWKNDEYLSMYWKKTLSPPGHACTELQPKPITVIDAKGRQHKVTINFCTCRGMVETLVSMHLWPSSPTNPTSAVHMDLLELQRCLLLEGAVSTQTFTAALTNMNADKQYLAPLPVNLYKTMVGQMAMEYRHLQYKVEHLVDIVEEYPDGTKCPMCDDQSVPGPVIISMDGNFRLVRKKKGCATTSRPFHHDKFFDKTPEDTAKKENAHDKSCSDFRAGDVSRSEFKSNRLDITGVFGSVCIHDFPQKFYNMDKGESLKYAVDIVRKYSQGKRQVNFMYDVCCRMKTHIAKARSDGNNIDMAVPVFHGFAHNLKCQVQYNPRRKNGYRKADGENIERFWSYLGKFSTITREMTSLNRHNLLVMALLHHGEKQISKADTTLLARHTKALQEIQQSQLCLAESKQALQEVDRTVNDTTIRKWIEEEENIIAMGYADKIQTGAVPWQEEYAKLLNKYYNTIKTIVANPTTAEEVKTKQYFQQLEQKIIKLERQKCISERWREEDDELTKHLTQTRARECNQLCIKMHKETVERRHLIHLKHKSKGASQAARVACQVKRVNRNLHRLLDLFNDLSSRKLTFDDIKDPNGSLFSNLDKLTKFPYSAYRNAIDSLCLQDRAKEERDSCVADLRALLQWHEDITSILGVAKACEIVPFKRARISIKFDKHVKCSDTIRNVLSKLDTSQCYNTVPMDKESPVVEVESDEDVDDVEDVDDIEDLDDVEDLNDKDVGDLDANDTE